MKAGKIPIITQNEFIMTYKGRVVRPVVIWMISKVNESEDKVKITIPKMEIQEITIDPNTIDFYDTSLYYI